MKGQEPMEKEVDRWFKSQRDRLQAPSNLWESLEPNLGPQMRPGWRELFGFRWVAFRLSMRVAGVAAAIGVVALTAVIYGAATGSLTPADDQTPGVRYGVPDAQWDSLRAQSNIFAEPTATVAAVATPTPAAAAPTAAETGTTAPGAVVSDSLYNTQLRRSSTQDRPPLIIIDSDSGIGSTWNSLQPMSRDRAEDFAEELIPPGGYGISPEQWNRLIEKLMAGDWSDIDTSHLPDGFFQSYGINPFIDTAEQPLSTFAMDVDTASYTVMRNYIESGRFPPPASVRPEEYINSFDQGYAPTDDTFGINVDGALSPYTDDGRFLLRIGINAEDVLPADRKPSNITLVVDTSGSMRQDNRIELVRKGIEAMLNEMREGDTVSIVAYENTARTVLSPTSDFDAARAVLSDLVPGGSTNAQAGLRTGFSLANDMFDVEKANHVILLSDGVANVGTTEPSGLLDDIKGYAQDGIYLSTVGVGMGDYNDTLLEQLANNGDGTYTYIDTVSEAERALGANITGLLEIVASDAKIQVDFNPDAVSSYRLVGYENRALADEDFRDDSVDAGEVGAGHTVTAIYELHLRADGDGDLGSVSIRWLDPDTGEAAERSRAITGSDVAMAFSDASPSFQLTASVMAFAEKLRASPYFKDVSLSAIAELLSTAIAGMDVGEEEVELQALVDRAAEIQRDSGAR